MASLVEDDETYVVAGNELGKDFLAGLFCPTFFLWPQLYFPEDYVREVESWRKPGQPEHLVHTRRVVTTSVRQKHLDVLWGEIGRFLELSVYPLLEKDGGPLAVNSLDIRFAFERHVKKPINYLVGMVSEKGEGMAGHHAAYNACVVDEASGVDDKVYEFAQGWMKKLLVFGNPHPCGNFFFKAVEGGNIQ